MSKQIFVRLGLIDGLILYIKYKTHINSQCTYFDAVYEIIFALLTRAIRNKISFEILNKNPIRIEKYTSTVNKTAGVTGCPTKHVPLK